ncbi:hypothetical protein ACQY0O_006562 [Thecaphora frezii]
MNQPTPSLAIVPPTRPTPSSISTHATSHPHHHGVHDAIRHGPLHLHHHTSHASFHPAHNRLENWHDTRQNLALTLQRNLFGLGLPARILMERNIVQQDPHFACLRVANLHLDILEGRDETLDPVDFLPAETSAEQLDIHSHMEKKYRI